MNSDVNAMFLLQKICKLCKPTNDRVVIAEVKESLRMSVYITLLSQNPTNSSPNPISLKHRILTTPLNFTKLPIHCPYAYLCDLWRRISAVIPRPFTIVGATPERQIATVEETEAAITNRGHSILKHGDFRQGAKESGVEKTKE